MLLTGIPTNYVVDESGKSAALALGCPACDSMHANYAYATGINNLHSVVGYWVDVARPNYFGYYYGIEWLLQGDTASSIVGLSSGVNGFALENAINDSGTAVGVAGINLGGANAGAAFDFKRGVFLGSSGSSNPCSDGPNSPISQATAINDAGTIVGSSENASCSNVVAVAFPASGAAVPFPVTPPSWANALNGSGDAVGLQNFTLTSDGVIGPGTTAFLYHVGNGASPPARTAARLPFPPGYSPSTNAMVASGINDAGDVVGDIYDSTGTMVAGFLYSKGRTYDLSALLPVNSGWTIQDAVAVNDRGEIIGFGTYAGQYLPYELKP